MSYHVIKETVTAWGEALDLWIRAERTPEERATSDCPGDPGCIEILSVLRNDRHGKDILNLLSEEELEQLQECVEQAINDEDQASADAGYEEAYLRKIGE